MNYKIYLLLIITLFPSLFITSCHDEETFKVPGEVEPALYGIWKSEAQYDKDYMAYYHIIYEFYPTYGYVITDKYYYDEEEGLINHRDIVEFNEWTLSKGILYMIYNEPMHDLRTIWTAKARDITDSSVIIDEKQYTKQ
ncbi:hypothetical protein LJB98_05705 [Bacteroidales bacterium OttesenSCG-928-M11]|nr:hypothetical protein [Bacteroidales bacterium OttesenSCG-928-M11]